MNTSKSAPIKTTLTLFSRQFFPSDTSFQLFFNNILKAKNGKLSTLAK